MFNQVSSSYVINQIHGTRPWRVVREFVTNTAVYPLFDAIRAISTEGLTAYLRDPPHYIIFIAAIIQAWFLGQTNLSWRARALGNIIAPTLYTAVDLLLEGWGSFWSEPNHCLYWIFSLGMALFYALEELFPPAKNGLIMLMNLWRVLLFPVLYAISELEAELASITVTNLRTYWTESSGHMFILLAAILLGFLLGLQEVQSDRYLGLLRQLAMRLKTISEWSLGPEQLHATIKDGQYALQQARVTRAVLFMDVRGFTKWSETREPEEVVRMLNEFYAAAEAIIAPTSGVKPHFIGDEVMTWFPTAGAGLATAVALRNSLSAHLAPFNLQIGVGIHYGEVVEGLLGSAQTRNFDIIGDTVNTASRLVSAAQPGELVVSDTLLAAVGNTAPPSRDIRHIQVKGKSDLLTVYIL